MKKIKKKDIQGFFEVAAYSFVLFLSGFMFHLFFNSFSIVNTALFMFAYVFGGAFLGFFATMILYDNVS